MILFLFLIAQLLIEMKTTVDKKEITVGDHIKYQIELRPKEEVRIELPKVEKMGNFEVLDKQEQKGKNQTKFIYTITTFKTGEDTIPSIAIKYISGDTGEVTTDPIVINVKSVLPPNIQDIKDIKSPVSIPRNLLPFIIGILFCIAAAIGYWRFYKKRIRVHPAQPVPVKPPHELAYERLGLLKLENGKIKEYYIELSDIIRRYIEGRYEIGAPTQTTFELYREMRRVKIRYGDIEMIKEFLNACDMVKFAKHIPVPEAIERDTKTAKEIVDKTK